MFKDLLFVIKYPYAAGIIAVIWFGSTGLIIVNDGLPITTIAIYNMVATLIISLVGFRVEK
ncbi:MAG: hypothetical protein A2632_01840 [Candidatus Pacebacteria bacterium RIFCSPHIGHO2_01_FULL_46_16]|nr:MAG: hypothetical protein A2632_01840 [Candidatus Pacebacteria bacterium RIFCSPHIGHO2_01_FULL_46_16]OGJ21815.1 MAG: hypothetical protein A3J60_03030 [Candidatus Pacebacteria bacterium RIFCSPHIGHO2_02_FULL_46_9]